MNALIVEEHTGRSLDRFCTLVSVTLPRLVKLCRSLLLVLLLHHQFQDAGFQALVVISAFSGAEFFPGFEILKLRFRQLWRRRRRSYAGLRWRCFYRRRLHFASERLKLAGSQSCTAKNRDELVQPVCSRSFAMFLLFRSWFRARCAFLRFFLYGLAFGGFGDCSCACTRGLLWFRLRFLLWQYASEAPLAIGLWLRWRCQGCAGRWFRPLFRGFYVSYFFRHCKPRFKFWQEGGRGPGGCRARPRVPPAISRRRIALLQEQDSWRRQQHRDQHRSEEH